MSQDTPDTRSKPKGAASLTADVVERGRHRTQVYGEAGLWRGAGAPSPAEAPVRVAFPQAPASDTARGGEPDEVVQEGLRLADELPPLDLRDLDEDSPGEGPEPRADLGLQLIGAVLVFAAVFVLGILFL